MLRVFGILGNAATTQLSKTTFWHSKSIPTPIGSMYTIYGNIYHQYTPFLLAYIPAPWILWDILRPIFDSSFEGIFVGATGSSMAISMAISNPRTSRSHPQPTALPSPAAPLEKCLVFEQSESLRASVYRKVWAFDDQNFAKAGFPWVFPRVNLAKYDAICFKARNCSKPEGSITIYFWRTSAQCFHWSCIDNKDLLQLSLHHWQYPIQKKTAQIFSVNLSLCEQNMGESRWVVNLYDETHFLDSQTLKKLSPQVTKQTSQWSSLIRCLHPTLLQILQYWEIFGGYINIHQLPPSSISMHILSYPVPRNVWARPNECHWLFLQPTCPVLRCSERSDLSKNGENMLQNAPNHLICPGQIIASNNHPIPPVPTCCTGGKKSNIYHYNQSFISFLSFPFPSLSSSQYHLVI